MFSNFEDFQTFGRGQIELATTAATTVSNGVQQIAAQATDFAKRVVDDSTSHLGKLAGAKSLDSAIQLQTEYAKSAYEDFVAQATRMGEIFTQVGKDVLKPVESAMVRAQAAAR